MPNKFLLIGALLLLSAAIDVVVAYLFLSPETRLVLYLAAASVGVVGVVFLLKGIANPSS